MNKVFKVIWSKVKQAYVVVSECSKNLLSKAVRERKRKESLIGILGLALAGYFFAMGLTPAAYAATSLLKDNSNDNSLIWTTDWGIRRSAGFENVNVGWKNTTGNSATSFGFENNAYGQGSLVLGS